MLPSCQIIFMTEEAVQEAPANESKEERDG